MSRAGTLLRRGFSLVEVLVALAIVSLLLVPMLSLMRPGTIEVSARLSQASYLLGRLLQTVRHMPYVRLQELLAKSTDEANGFCLVDVTALIPKAAAAVGGLESGDVALYLRVTPHVAGQYGLDRVDLKLAYGTGEKLRWMTRSFVRRNARELTAMSRLRLYRPISDMSDDQVRKAVKQVAQQTALMPSAQRKRGSPFLVPSYPGILKNFEGFDADPETAAATYEAEGLGGDDGLDMIPWGDALADGEAPRPRFADTAGICD